MKRSGAIIGFGKIAESTHLDALRAAHLQIVAVVETSPERQLVARAMLPDARIYTTPRELLSNERLDFVDICTPPHLHFDAAQQAIIAGVHVLCEKPLVLNAADGAKLAKLANEHHVAIACVHNWTQAPILVRARTLAQSNAFGPLRKIDLMTWRTKPAAGAADSRDWRIDPLLAGGGILFDHGWHGMSILLRSAGSHPVSVRGHTEKRRYHDLLVEDTSETWVRFGNGVMGRFEATWAAQERSNRAYLSCQDALIAVENDTLKIWRNGEVVDSETFSESLAEGGYRPDWTAAIVQEFKDEMNDVEMRGVLLTEALTALQLLIATYESSAQCGQEVALTSVL